MVIITQKCIKKNNYTVAVKDNCVYTRTRSHMKYHYSAYMYRCKCAEANIRTHLGTHTEGENKVFPQIVESVFLI